MVVFKGTTHGSFGTLPGLPDSNHGRLSQNSSLIISRCSTTIAALARFFLSFSLCDLDWVTGSARFSTSRATLWVPGSTGSYCEDDLATALSAGLQEEKLTSLKTTLPFLKISGSLL